MLARWTTGAGADELAKLGMTPEQVMADTRANTPVSREHAEHLVDRFLDEI